MAIVSVDIDLAKNVFAVHGVDESDTRPYMRFVPVKSIAQQLWPSAM